MGPKIGLGGPLDYSYNKEPPFLIFKAPIVDSLQAPKPGKLVHLNT